MAITIFTSGTRGDVQPFIPLAKGLLRAGYGVRIAANSDFRGLVGSR